MTDLETAVFAAENAAREALVANGILPTGLVLTVCFGDGNGGAYACASKTPHPVPEFLAASLYQSAQDAGLTTSDMY